VNPSAEPANEGPADPLIGQLLAGRYRSAPVPLEEALPDVQLPPQLGAVIAQALARKRAGRHADTASFMPSLHAAAEGQPVNAVAPRKRSSRPYQHGSNSMGPRHDPGGSASAAMVLAQAAMTARDDVDRRHVARRAADLAAGSK
jgi:hypothetical protein